VDRPALLRFTATALQIRLPPPLVAAIGHLVPSRPGLGHHHRHQRRRSLRITGDSNWTQIKSLISNLAWQSAVYNTGNGCVMHLGSAMITDWNKVADGSPAIDGGAAGAYITYGMPPFLTLGGGAKGYSSGAGKGRPAPQSGAAGHDQHGARWSTRSRRRRHHGVYAMLQATGSDTNVNLRLSGQAPAGW